MQVPVSVVVPTIGRAALLERCLASIVGGTHTPVEIVVVDQSGDDAVAAVVAAVAASHGNAGARLVPDPHRGIASAMNCGLRAATAPHVAVTHDDCTVRDDWVAAAGRHAAHTPDAIVTGQVVPDGPPERVPSTRVSNVPFDFTGTDSYGVLYPASMVAPRAALLDFGGFDERPSFMWAAEDNDLCYRWLRAGRALRFEPELVVFHHDWRSPADLAELYRRYARAQGAFYAKHLLRGDTRMLRFMANDLASGARSVAGGVRHRRPRWSDERRFLLRGLPAGFVVGARDELAIRRSPRRAGGPSS